MGLGMGMRTGNGGGCCNAMLAVLHARLYAHTCKKIWMGNLPHIVFPNSERYALKPSAFFCTHSIHSHRTKNASVGGRAKFTTAATPAFPNGHSNAHKCTRTRTHACTHARTHARTHLLDHVHALLVKVLDTLPYGNALVPIRESEPPAPVAKVRRYDEDCAWPVEEGGEELAVRLLKLGVQVTDHDRYELECLASHDVADVR